jgi:hypothetical protein
MLMAFKNKNLPEFSLSRDLSPDNSTAGFVPMMVMLVTVLIAMIVFVYIKVNQAQK